MSKEDLIRRLESMKGLTGSGTVLSEAIRKVADFIGTMEPGDFVNTGTEKVSAVPVSTDLWYLFYHQNFLRKYYKTGTELAHKADYLWYFTTKLVFLRHLTGLKPLKVLVDLAKDLTVHQYERFDPVWDKHEVYQNNGTYWINSIFFELIFKNKQIQYPSEGSPRYKTHPNEYVGYIAFPIGQLGVMEVISLFQETDLRGYQFKAFETLGLVSLYHAKPAVSNLDNKYIPTVQSPPPLMFPDAKTKTGDILSGQNYCYGKHLIESAYRVTDTVTMPFTKGNYPLVEEKLVQNTKNSSDETAYAPIATNDLELWASNIKDYGEDIKPKLWMRYWIHKDSTLPVPGEFIGILVRPVATPPHVWWFQESSPFLYAGNWMETGNLTSGIITSVTKEADRPAGSVGNEYKAEIQGVEVTLYATDFFLYSVGDRVAILKADSLTPATKSFTALNQFHFNNEATITVTTLYVIVPATFYKIKH